MKYFKQAVLEKKNIIKIRKFEFPKLKSGQLLIKILYSGVCKSQLMEASGLRGYDKWLPHGFGHEASGEVIDNNKSKKFKKKDKVICSWIRRPNRNASRSGYHLFDSTRTKVNFGDITTFGEYAIISENCVYKKPKNLNFKEAALFGCAIPTGMGMVFNELSIKKKDNILLIGLGGIGLSSLIALKIKGLEKKTFILEKNIKKNNIARKLGFINFLNLKDLNTKYRNYFDKCIETSGVNNLIEIGFELINSNGHLIFASHPENNKFIKINPHDLIKGKKITGSWGGACKLDKDINKFSTLISKRRINLKIFFNKIYELKQLDKALLDLKNNKTVRPIIKM